MTDAALDMDEPEMETEDDSAEPVADPAEIVPLEDHDQQKRLVEALIFASPEPLTLRAVQNRLPSSADTGRILTELQVDYAERGVNLVRLEDSWAFRTADDIGPHLALQKKEEKKLSRAALETMAIIAYHQPVTRAEVENIRGVATNKGTLDVLMESGWIKPGRRRETPGRPVTWLTTTRFLDDFGVSSLTDLPGLQELKASGLLDTRPAIDTIPGADLFNSANENISEDDQAADTLGEFDQQTDEKETDMIDNQEYTAAAAGDDEIEDMDDDAIETGEEEFDEDADEDLEESDSDDLDDDDLDDEDDGDDDLDDDDLDDEEEDEEEE